MDNFMTDEEDTKGQTDVEIKKSAHALEEWLDIEEGTTEQEKVKYNFPTKQSEHYDPKDREIERQAHEVFEEAMSGYKSLDQIIENMEPKYRARMAEVALQYLKTALDATDHKSKQKESIEKLSIQKEKVQKTSSSGNNTTVYVGDRNDILKQIRRAQDSEEGVIDVTPENEEEGEDQKKESSDENEND
jgi:hypothetical protein